MPYSPKPDAPTVSEELKPVLSYIQEEFQAIARAMTETTELELRPSAREPDNPREGMVVYADGTNWNPGSGAGNYQFVAGAWVLQRSGVEPNSYGTVTDGTTPAPANSAGATFKLRAGTGLSVATQNNDGTHGDNALYSLVLGALASVAPVLADKLPFADTSNSDANARTTIQLLLDLIGTLTTEASPDFAADFLALYDASGAVAKKVALSKFGQPDVLISTTALTGSSVNITVPSGYRDVRLAIKAGLLNSSSVMNIRFSENAGSSFLSQVYHMFNDGLSSLSNNSNNAPALYNGTTSSQTWWQTITLRDYLSAVNKFTEEHGIIAVISAAAGGWAGSRMIQSTAAINQINLNPNSGNFTSGSAELWGVL